MTFTKDDLPEKDANRYNSHNIHSGAHELQKRVATEESKVGLGDDSIDISSIISSDLSAENKIMELQRDHSRSI